MRPYLVSGFAKHAEAERRLLHDGDEEAIRRMAHLRPYGVTVRPFLSTGQSAISPTPSKLQARLRPLAERIMAIQMWHAAHQSALK